MPRRYSTRSARAPQHNNVVAGGARGDSGLPRRDRSIDRSIASARVTLTVVTHATKARVPHTRARATHTDRHDCDTRSPLATRRSDRVVTRGSSIAPSHERASMRCAQIATRRPRRRTPRLRALTLPTAHGPRESDHPTDTGKPDHLTDRGISRTPPGNRSPHEPREKFLSPHEPREIDIPRGRPIYPAAQRTSCTLI